MVDIVRPPIKYISMILIVVSVILDFAIYKWRHLADWILYIDIPANCIAALSPAEENNTTELYCAIVFFVYFVLLYTDTAG